MKRSFVYWRQLVFCLILICLLLLIVFSIISLTTIKSLGESIKPIIEVIAILAGGWWSYRLFIKNRLDYPVAEITHQISNHDIDSKFQYISVLVTMKNISKVLIELDFCQILVQQMFPLQIDILEMLQKADPEQIRLGIAADLFSPRDKQITWREIGYRDYEWEKGIINLEPGQTDVFQYEFIVKKETEIIRVISYFHNKKITSTNVGWRTPTIYKCS